MKCPKAVTFVVLLVCARNACQATPIVSLSTLGPPSATVGVPFTVDVTLSGLEVGQELDSLLATISFDAAMLGTPSITPGAIVPNPLDDPFDLLISESLGLADVAFLTFGTDAADHIMGDGVFFSFELTPLLPGTGEIAIDFVGATSFNATDPNDPTDLQAVAGGPLSFTVVPEPGGSTLIALILFCGAVGGRGWRWGAN